MGGGDCSPSLSVPTCVRAPAAGNGEGMRPSCRFLPALSFKGLGRAEPGLELGQGV